MNVCILACCLLASATIPTWGASLKRSSVSTVDPYIRQEAENYDQAYGVAKYSCSTPACGSYIGNVNNGDFLVFYAMDFGEGATGFQLSVAADADKYDRIGTLFLHLDNVTTSPFASVVLGNTGDVEYFVAIGQFIQYPPVGVRDLCLTFATNFADSDIGNIDWFQFYRIGTSSAPLPPPGGNSGRMAATKDAFSKIQAEAWDYQSGIKNSECTQKDQCESYVGYIQRGDAVGYFAVDFQNGATGLAIALGGKSENGDVVGTIYFHLDNTSTSPFAAVVTGNTGAEQQWVQVKQFIEYAPSGVHDLYFTFNADSNGDIGNIAWFQFYRVQ